MAATSRLLLLAVALGFVSHSVGAPTCTLHIFDSFYSHGISDDGKIVLGRILNSQTETFCVLDRTEMVNNTNKGLYCSNLGKAVSLSKDGSMVSFAVGRAFCCMIKTADLKSPGSTSLARCMGWKTAGEPKLALSEDGSEGAFYSKETGEWFIGAIAYDSIVQWTEQGLMYPQFADYIPAGEDSQIARDGSVAYAQTLKGEGRSAVIWDPWTGAYTNGSMKWANDPVWGSGEKDEQYLFYVASLPGETTNVCAFKNGGAAKCSTFTLRAGYSHSSLITGFSLSGKPVAIIGLAKDTTVSLVCTLPLGGGAAELTCVSGFQRFVHSDVSLPQPEVWFGLFFVNSFDNPYYVDMSTITENPLSKQKRAVGPDATDHGPMLAGRAPVYLGFTYNFTTNFKAACFFPLHPVS